MATYIILSRISPQAFTDPKEFRQIATTVSKKIKQECAGIRWKASYSTFDIVDAEDAKEVEKAAMIIRAYGHSTTETLPAVPWREFLKML